MVINLPRDPHVHGIPESGLLQRLGERGRRLRYSEIIEEKKGKLCPMESRVAII